MALKIHYRLSSQEPRLPCEHSNEPTTVQVWLNNSESTHRQPPRTAKAGAAGWQGQRGIRSWPLRDYPSDRVSAVPSGPNPAAAEGDLHDALASPLKGHHGAVTETPVTSCVFRLENAIDRYSPTSPCDENIRAETVRGVPSAVTPAAHTPWTLAPLPHFLTSRLDDLKFAGHRALPRAIRHIPHAPN